jgi:hypothetical protein
VGSCFVLIPSLLCDRSPLQTDETMELLHWVELLNPQNVKVAERMFDFLPKSGPAL